MDRRVRTHLTTDGSPDVGWERVKPRRRRHGAVALRLSACLLVAANWVSGAFFGAGRPRWRSARWNESLIVTAAFGGRGSVRPYKHCDGLRSAKLTGLDQGGQTVSYAN